MSRVAKAVSWISGGISLLIIAACIFLAKYDFNRLKPALNSHLSALLERPFSIRGDLKLVWHRHSSRSGWLHWLPWPHMLINDVTMGNPAGFPASPMLHLQQLEARLLLLPLMQRRVVLSWLKLQRPTLYLLRTIDKKNNWTFHFKQEVSDNKTASPAWRFELNNLLFDQGKISLLDAANDAKLHFTVKPLSKVILVNQSAKDKQARGAASDYALSWHAQGTYRNEQLLGEGKIGSVFMLAQGKGALPVQADIRNGTTRIQLTGQLYDLFNQGDIDLRLRFAGDTLANLYGITGVLLPDTPPFETEGHLLVQLNHPQGALYHYKDFNGRIGNSDIHGVLSYQLLKARPKLMGKLTSKQLSLADLGPLIGVDSGKGSEQTKRASAQRSKGSVQPGTKVLPIAKFATHSWHAMDADVLFQGENIQNRSGLRLRQFNTHLTLDSGSLRLNPLRFTLAGGQVDSHVHLDSNHQPLIGRISLRLRKLQLRDLLPNLPTMRRALGYIYGDIVMSGVGNSVAELLASSNGKADLLMSDGRISRNLMELLGLNVGNYIVGELFGDEEVRINCAAASAIVSSGVVTPKPFILDTSNAFVSITGNVNLASEQLDLTITPKSKGVRVFTLRTPLYVKGSFQHPQSGVKTGPLIVRSIAAVSLASLLTPAAALLALISPSDRDDDQCAVLLEKMK